MTTYILLALGAISMIIFLLFRTKDGGLLPATLKTVTSLIFIATGIAAICDNYNINGNITTTTLISMGLIILGLVCGLIGDLTLDLKITYLPSNVRHSDYYTYFGMGAFGIGHVLFIIAISLLYGFSAWTLLIAFGATAVIFGTSIFVMKMKFGKFIIPSILYGFLLTMFLACTVAAGLMTAFSTSVIMLVIGAALFLASDLVLSMTYFENKDGRIMIVINHVLYYGAQFLIALSIMYIGQ